MLKTILAAADLGFADVVKTTIFLTSMGDFAAVNEVYKGYVGEPYPARSTIASWRTCRPSRAICGSSSKSAKAPSSTSA